VLARRTIASGAALERFRRMVEHQGGDPRVVDDEGRLPRAPRRHRVQASRSGFLAALDAGLVGRASALLGAGRDVTGTSIDPSVGILVLAKPGDELAAGDPILELHYRDEARREAALPLALSSIVIADARPAASAAILSEVS
jgi:thymidine phosphorylase